MRSRAAAARTGRRGDCALSPTATRAKVRPVSRRCGIGARRFQQRARPRLFAGDERARGAGCGPEPGRGDAARRRLTELERRWHAVQDPRRHLRAGARRDRIARGDEAAAARRLSGRPARAEQPRQHLFHERGPPGAPLAPKAVVSMHRRLARFHARFLERVAQRRRRILLPPASRAPTDRVPSSPAPLPPPQAMLHAPLLDTFFLSQRHTRESCQISQDGGFCIACEMVRGERRGGLAAGGQETEMRDGGSEASASPSREPSLPSTEGPTVGVGSRALKSSARVGGLARCRFLWRVGASPLLRSHLASFFLPFTLLLLPLPSLSPSRTRWCTWRTTESARRSARLGFYTLGGCSPAGRWPATRSRTRTSFSSSCSRRWGRPRATPASCPTRSSRDSCARACAARTAAPSHRRMSSSQTSRWTCQTRRRSSRRRCLPGRRSRGGAAGGAVVARRPEAGAAAGAVAGAAAAARPRRHSVRTRPSRPTRTARASTRTRRPRRARTLPSARPTGPARRPTRTPLRSTRPRPSAASSRTLASAASARARPRRAP